MTRSILVFCLVILLNSTKAQDPIDPAFDPPLVATDTITSQLRWSGGMGIGAVDEQFFQQFSLRPDWINGHWAAGLDLTIQIDENGKFRDNDWDDGLDYIEKIHFIRHGIPGDPFYMRIGSLENVSLGHGMILRQYSNTIQYPEMKRVGGYFEGELDRITLQGIFNNARELGEPGLLGGRIALDTGLKRLKIGATISHDGNQFAGLGDSDDDGIPDDLDQFSEENDFQTRERLFNTYSNAQLRHLIESGYLPDVFKKLLSYDRIKESVTILGADADVPLFRARRISFRTHGQIARIIDYGWGWAFPGMRMATGPVEIGAEFRHYESEFIGEFFDYSYELSRTRLVGDSAIASKESRLHGLGPANGYYTDVLITPSQLGYVFAWYSKMNGNRYPLGNSIYLEAGITPSLPNHLKKISGYYYQPGVSELFQEFGDGLIYGGKLFLNFANNLSLIYDHRIFYTYDKRHRVIRVEASLTF